MTYTLVDQSPTRIQTGSEIPSMRKLSLSDWAHLAEVITSVFVIISIIYVGIELRQNTQELQLVSYLGTQESMINADLTVAANADLNLIVMKADTAPDSVSEEEWARYKHYLFPRLGTWEFLFLSYRNETASVGQWLAFEPYFLHRICNPGYRHFWLENRPSFDPNFAVYVDDQIASRCREPLTGQPET
jgi:hypothetical protein